jgi:hypothetical protein
MAKIQLSIPASAYLERLILLPRTDGKWEFRYCAPLQLDGHWFYDVIFEDLSQVQRKSEPDNEGKRSDMYTVGDFIAGTYTRREFDSKELAMAFASALAPKLYFGCSGYTVLETLEAVDEYRKNMRFPNRLL